MQFGIIGIHSLRMGIYPLITYFFKTSTPTAKTCKIIIPACKFLLSNNLTLKNLQRVLQVDSIKGPDINHPLPIIQRWFPFPATSFYIFYETNIHKNYIYKNSLCVSTINSKIINLQKYPLCVQLKNTPVF